MKVYKPYDDYVAVRIRDDKETQTESGLHVVREDIHSSEPMVADVIAVGDSVKSVVAGDVIVADRYAGSEHAATGIVYVREEVILAVVDV